MESNSDLPASLNEAIFSEPMWLQAWVLLLVVTNLGALLFAVKRGEGGLGVRAEPIAILIGFLGAVVFMDWIYGQVGYVRLLGLAHLVFWGPVWLWLMTRRKAIGTADFFGKYVHFYLVIAGISLLIDAIDVARHLLGDGALLHRWNS